MQPPVLHRKNDWPTNSIGALNGTFGTIGCFFIGLFFVSWIISAITYRARDQDRHELNI